MNTDQYSGVVLSGHIEGEGVVNLKLAASIAQRGQADQDRASMISDWASISCANYVAVVINPVDLYCIAVARLLAGQKADSLLRESARRVDKARSASEGRTGYTFNSRACS